MKMTSLCVIIHVSVYACIKLYIAYLLTLKMSNASHSLYIDLHEVKRRIMCARKIFRCRMVSYLYVMSK